MNINCIRRQGVCLGYVLLLPCSVVVFESQISNVINKKIQDSLFVMSHNSSTSYEILVFET